PSQPSTPVSLSISLSCVLYVFFSCLRRRPTSTLFPYTTLFRSHSSGATVPPAVLSQARGFWLPSPSPAKGSAPWLGVSIAKPRRDRKSTRLNSSHGSISYAVFCLKKKNLKSTVAAGACRMAASSLQEALADATRRSHFGQTMGAYPATEEKLNGMERELTAVGMLA